MTARIIVGAYIVVAAFASLYFIVDGALPNVMVPISQESGDGNVTLTCAYLWNKNIDPYGEEWLRSVKLPHVGHPPSTPFWFLPFRGFSHRQAHGVTGITVLLMLVILILLIASELRAPVLPATVALVFAFIIDRTWMRYHLANMQLGIPIALLLVLAWLFLRRGRQIEGGAMLGLATSIKFFPGVMMLFLLLTRRYKAFIAGAIAWFVVAAIMTWGYGGPKCWPEYFSKGKETADFWLGSIKNASIQGVVLRAFFPACHRRFGTWPAASLIAGVLSLALLAASAWWSRRLAQKDQFLDAPFALFAVVSVFINPVVWEHYDVLLLLPWAIAAWLLAGAAREGMARWLVWGGAATLALVVWLVSFDSELKTRPDLLGSNPHLMMHLYEVANWIVWPIMIALLGALVFRQNRREFSSRIGSS